MRLWYLLFSSILFFVVCCEAQNKGLYAKSNRNSLLKFFKLNNGVTNKGSVGLDHSSVNAKLNVSNKGGSSLSPSLKCEQNFTTTFGKPNCTEKHKSNAVKKSFRPNDYDDDEDYDDPPGDYDDSPEDEEFSEEETRGSYRAFDDSPPIPPEEERFRDYEPEDDRGRNPEFEFEDEPPDGPGYEDTSDGENANGWDWRASVHHHDRARWRSHYHPQYDNDDDYEPSYYPRFHHHPRRVHYHHNQYHRPAVHASYRTFGQARPSWPPYTQGYQSFSSTPAPVPYAPYPVGWTNSPAVQTNWQSPYFSSAALQSFNAIGPRVINPYLQNTFNSPQQQTNSFFVPSSSHLVQSPTFLEATARNVVSFTRTLPGIAATLPRLSHDIFHYSRFNPLLASRRNHFGHQSSGPLPRHSEFPDAILNRIRELNLH